MATGELPESKSALKRLAIAGRSALKRGALDRMERRESRDELIGAVVLLPVVKNLANNVAFLKQMGLPPPLRDAAVSYGISVFTRGMISDMAWGSCLGAIGAYTYNTEGLLGGLFGK